MKIRYKKLNANAVCPTYGSEYAAGADLYALTEGEDITIIACGEMVKPALDAAALLKEKGVTATVLDMYCVKPIDQDAVIRAAENARAILTVEEHAPFGGLGSMVSQIVAEHCPKKVKNLTLPDAPVVTGTSAEVFAHYHLDAEGIAAAAEAIL